MVLNATPTDCDTSGPCPTDGDAVLTNASMGIHSANIGSLLQARWPDTVPDAGHSAVNKTKSLLALYSHSAWWADAVTQQLRNKCKICHLVISVLKHKTKQTLNK